MLWSGALNFYGYGQFSFEGRTWSAHRLAYEIANGPIFQDAKKWWVLHKCDNPACCNPNHLYLGDAKDNVNDMIDRKRQRMGFKRYGSAENTRFGRVFYEIGGEIKTLFERAYLLNVNPSTLDQRLSAGWPEEDLGMSSKAYKRHLKIDCQTNYRRFSGTEEVENYKSETSKAATCEVSNLPVNLETTDMNSLATQTATINVPFHGDNLYLVNFNGQPYVPMKPVVEGMGLAWGAQFIKIKQRFNSTISEIEMVAMDGKKRDMTCLALRKLPGWLHTINVGKVRPELRDKVARYQEECDDVLYQYWMKGEVKNPRKKTTVDERTPLRDAVNMLVGKKGLRYDDAYTMVHQRFGIDSIDELSLEQIPLAVEYIHRVVLEGEFLGRQEALPAPELDINFPISWFVENAPYTVIRQQCGDTITLDRAALVDCSPAYKLVSVLTKAGYDVSAVIAELKALRSIMDEQSWAMKEIASYVAVRDRSCHRISL